MNDSFSLELVARLESLPEIHRFVEQATSAFGLESSDIHDIRLAVEEAVTNTIMHGYPNEGGRVEIEFAREGQDLKAYLRDDGITFDSTSVPPPDLSRPFEERASGGLGIYLMRQMVDEMHHRTPADGGNELMLVKRGVCKA
jgi:anti-sigma regulatory factor (Ser/Thr protein kinase)